MLTVSVEVLVLLFLIAFNGVLAMSELALVSSRTIRLQQRADRGDEGARVALELGNQPTRFLSTVQIGITLVGIIAGAFGGASLASDLASVIEDAGVSASLADTLGVIVVVAIITYLTLVFGELVPKRIAMQHPEAIASALSRPMRVLSTVSAPLVWLLSTSTSAILRVLHIQRPSSSEVTEEEIRLLIGRSAETGAVAEEEAELLDRVFHFGDRRVHEVMIPRTEAVWLEKDSAISDFFAVYRDAPHSRFPVYDDSYDNIVGILGIKDVLAAIARAEATDTTPIAGLLRPAMHVPETKLIGELFREMQQRGVQMAVAVDEFGGTAGILTLEQLLEEMVGQLHDELRPEELEIQEIDERTVDVDGSLSVGEARDELEMDIPEGPYDTIAGFVLERLGHIPHEGEVLPLDGSRLIVSEMKGPKIERLRLVRL